MRKDRLYLLTLTGISLAVLCINVLSINQLIKMSTEQLLSAQLTSSKREAYEISKILETQLGNNIPPNEISSGLQRSIENTSMETGFICMYNTSGVEICHPDPKRIGLKIDRTNSQVTGIGVDHSENFIDVLQKGQASGGLRDFMAENRSEIIYVYPVKNTEWMVAAHANISTLQKQISTIKVNIILINTLASILIILFSFTIVRWLGSKYEMGIELEKEGLVDDLRSLSKLNLDINEYKNKVDQYSAVAIDAAGKPTSRLTEEKPKKRLLTYWRDELVSVPVEDIAFLHTQNSLTYIHCHTKHVYNSNSSLDELFESLDKSIFFRANRQFVISIRSIEKIYRFGASQLKIATATIAPEDVIISKNKAAEFKEWLNS